MKYLGVDYGSKRVGLARGDDENRLAIPLRTIPKDKELYNLLRNMLRNKEFDEIVLGVPVSFDGKEHAQAQEVRLFGENLNKEIGIPVHFQNELLTSSQAERSGVSDVDASAAALILQ